MMTNNSRNNSSKTPGPVHSGTSPSKTATPVHNRTSPSKTADPVRRPPGTCREYRCWCRECRCYCGRRATLAGMVNAVCLVIALYCLNVLNFGGIIMSQESAPAVTDTNPVIATISNAFKRLHQIGEQKAVSDIVYSFLKHTGLEVSEGGAEALCGTKLGQIIRIRSGKIDPAYADVMRELAVMDKYAKEHNAPPHLSSKLPRIDLVADQEALSRGALQGKRTVGHGALQARVQR